MNVKEEMLYDFSLKMPRLLISGKTGILDHVRKIMLISQTCITVDHGNRFSTVNGENLCVLSIEEERMIITGNIASIEFYQTKKGDDDA